VQVQSVVCKTAALPFPHYDLDLTRPFLDQLAKIMNHSNHQRTLTVQGQELRDWCTMDELYRRWFGTDGIGSPRGAAVTSVLDGRP
jgi:hypothetical protein